MKLKPQQNDVLMLWMTPALLEMVRCLSCCVQLLFSDQRSDTGADGAVWSNSDLQLNTVSVQHNRLIHSAVNLWSDFYRSFTWRMSDLSLPDGTGHPRSARLNADGPYGSNLPEPIRSVSWSRAEDTSAPGAHDTRLTFCSWSTITGQNWWVHDVNVDRYKIKHSTSQ